MTGPSTWEANTASFNTAAWKKSIALAMHPAVPPIARSDRCDQYYLQIDGSPVYIQWNADALIVLKPHIDRASRSRDRFQL